MKTVTIYTDGACSGNPGPGGWAAILQYGEYERELSGYEADTTNNRMELLAAIKGLETLNQPCAVQMYTDSAYLCDAFNHGWILNWQRNGWQTKSKQPVKNAELWQRLIKLGKLHAVTWHKVPGHADNVKNNRCDALARAAIKIQNACVE